MSFENPDLSKTKGTISFNFGNNQPNSFNDPVVNTFEPIPRKIYDPFNPINPVKPFNPINPVNPAIFPSRPPIFPDIPEPLNPRPTIFPSICSQELYQVALFGTLFRKQKRESILSDPHFTDSMVRCDGCQRTDLRVYLHYNGKDLCLVCTDRILETLPLKIFT
ncbi:putative ORFan [Tupanvirus deep ocean]|uniref:ORFan n=2 Tax=Tupanvirus TaxID=2094720 RepID=A0AC62A7R9_9VIRU|nr:putative ORFan [Tupanvirus deep ocean]QKU33832.1 putative ORFan [Tupanvirus deep ocean]